MRTVEQLQSDYEARKVAFDEMVNEMRAEVQELQEALKEEDAKSAKETRQDTIRVEELEKYWSNRFRETADHLLRLPHSAKGSCQSTAEMTMNKLITEFLYDYKEYDELILKVIHRNYPILRITKQLTRKKKWLKFLTNENPKYPGMFDEAYDLKKLREQIETQTPQQHGNTNNNENNQICPDNPGEY